MNIVLIVIGIICLLEVLNGLRVGLVRSIFSTFALFASMALAAYGGPYAAKFLKTTPVYTMVYSAAETTIFDNIQTELTAQTGEQVNAINQLPLPEAIRNGLIENNNAETYVAMGAESFASYIAEYISTLVINALAYLVVFIIAYIILKIACSIVNSVMNLPGLRHVNRIGGAAFGACNAVMAVWLFFVLVTAVSTTGWGQEILKQINDSAILTYLYDHNILINVVKNIRYIF